MAKAYARRVFRGVTLNERTIAMILTVEKRLGFALGLTQGSYNAGGVSASGGTHDGGGAVDFSVVLMGHKKQMKVMRACRDVGFADWHRPALAGEWPTHNHGIAIGDHELSAAAAAQVPDYRNLGNGLWPLVGGDDLYPYRPSPIPEFDYQAYQDRVARRARLERINDRIGELSRDVRGLHHRLAAKVERIQRKRKLKRDIREHR